MRKVFDFILITFYSASYSVETGPRACLMYFKYWQGVGPLKIPVDSSCRPWLLFAPRLYVVFLHLSTLVLIPLRSYLLFQQVLNTILVALRTKALSFIPTPRTEPAEPVR